MDNPIVPSPSEDKVEDIILAEPTKDFFISMLVKDIELSRAIIDLVDNCIDGARRMRPNGDYQGLKIDIEVYPDRFSITDNCGGIPIDVARKYAFRFGRPENIQGTPYSVGLFGVGMKRALFKIGNYFKVESTHSSSHFIVEEDVNEWKNKREWKFRMSSREEGTEEIPTSDWGTRISVTQIYMSISLEFENDLFKTKLAKEIEEAHLYSMNQGLTITINETPLKIKPIMFRASEEIRPAYKEMHINGHPGRKIDIKLYSGIAESDPAAAGWYVFCNGRLVLGADQSRNTGWGEGPEKKNPKYHNQFARFRGYAFFEAENTNLLPWNTTKTGVDVGSESYRSAKLEMTKLMRPVIDFLNQLDDEIEVGKAGGETPLTFAVENTTLVQLEQVQTSSDFTAPESTANDDYTMKMRRISYKKPINEYERVRSILNARSAAEVGERTFDYFYRLEVDE